MQVIYILIQVIYFDKITFFVVCNQQLRVNEFGIYELVPGEESTAEKPTAEKPNETIQITEVVSAEKELSPEVIVAPPSTDADSIPQPTKPGSSFICRFSPFISLTCHLFHG